MKNNLMKKCIAEFIGTFALVFFGCGSMILYELNPNAISPDAIPIIFGLIIAVMIYVLGLLMMIQIMYQLVNQGHLL